MCKDKSRPYSYMVSVDDIIEKALNKIAKQKNIVIKYKNESVADKNFKTVTLNEPMFNELVNKLSSGNVKKEIVSVRLRTYSLN